MNVDLSSVAIINESSSSEVVGDVTLFRNFESLAAWTEPIDVENNEYFAYSLAGDRLNLNVESDRVKVTKANDGVNRSAHVRKLLEATAEHVIRASNRESVTGIDPKLLSLRELIDVIGFAR